MFSLEVEAAMGGLKRKSIKVFFSPAETKSCLPAPQNSSANVDVEYASDVLRILGHLPNTDLGVLGV